MSVAEHIERLGGVATSSQLKEAGFAPGVIEYALNSGKIDRLTRGVYCSLDVLDDEFAAVTMLAKVHTFAWNRAVFAGTIRSRAREPER